MKKRDFLTELEKRLSGLPKSDIDERIEFYSEMIDDMVEEGKTEEDAVSEIGSIDDVVNEIAKDTPLTKLVKTRIKPKRTVKAWEIVLLALGFPLWFPLLITAFVLLFVAYVLIWVLVIVSYSVELSVIVSGIAGFIVYFLQGGNLGYLAVGLLGVGFAIVFYFVCASATKLTISFTKRLLLKIKKSFIGGKKDE